MSIERRATGSARSGRERSPSCVDFTKVLALVLGLLATSGCSESPADAESDADRASAALATSHEGTAGAVAPAFVEIAQEVGLHAAHDNGVAGQWHMAEVSGSGVGLFDYDRDGDLDVYMVQGGPLPTVEADATSRQDHLWRNDGSGSDALLFTDVTRTSGDLGTGYGMGVAAGDYDGDGDLDLYVTALDGNQLLEAQGDGTFRDVTTRAGVGEPRWSVPSAFFDFDRDGDLDLYVGNYVAVPERKPPACRDMTGAEDYCGPDSFRPIPDRLFENLGDGTFRDVSHAAGFLHEVAPALGVLVIDHDEDGWLDLYVANDGSENHLWRNLGDGRFENVALLSGTSVNAEGRSEASMGVDAGDFDADGDLDLFMTHLVSESNTLYRNGGGGLFDDHTTALGLAAPSRLHTSFGTAFIDHDNDGWLDLFVANGAVKKIESLVQRGDAFPFHETNQLFHNRAGGRFVELVAGAAGSPFALSEVSRGAAFGDVDNDGDVDILVSHNGGPLRLLENRSPSQPWIGVHVLEPSSTGALRDSPGALVEVLGAARALVRRVRIEGSYASTSDPRVLVGLGGEAFWSEGPPETLGIVVRWPDGVRERWPGLAVGRYHDLQRGSGQVSP